MKVYTQFLVAVVLLQLLHEGWGAVTPSVRHVNIKVRESPKVQVKQAAAGATPVSTGYKQYGSADYYKPMPVALPLTDAMSACAKEGASLLVLDSPEKRDVARNIMLTKPTFSGTTDQWNIWTGITNRKNNLDFETIRGKPVKDIKGYGGPAQSYPMPNRCLVWNGANYYFQVTCDAVSAFICEKASPK